ncbi:MAG: FUN14 domain-containing protein [Candidatus Bathyarchaeota archaeon]|nr:FUN14 domain-containing protein [Candidatus Bathyarchaeota archaeon]
MLSPLIVQLGFGGVAGFIAGYAFKKILKILLVFLGLGFMALLYLSYMGFITINYGKILSSFQEPFKKIAGGDLTLPTILAANIPFLGSFIVGLGLGFKLG